MGFLDLSVRNSLNTEPAFRMRLVISNLPLFVTATIGESNIECAVRVNNTVTCSFSDSRLNPGEVRIQHTVTLDMHILYIIILVSCSLWLALKLKSGALFTLVTYTPPTEDLKFSTTDATLELYLFELFSSSYRLGRKNIINVCAIWLIIFAKTNSCRAIYNY